MFSLLGRIHMHLPLILAVNLQKPMAVGGGTLVRNVSVQYNNRGKRKGIQCKPSQQLMFILYQTQSLHLPTESQPFKSPPPPRLDFLWYICLHPVLAAAMIFGQLRVRFASWCVLDCGFIIG
jgi:hypothetical protein